MVKINKKVDLALHHGPNLIEFYRANPSIAAYDLLGVDLAPVQRVVFEAMWFKPYTIAVCTRGFGKSSYVREMGFFRDKGLLYLDEVLPKIPSYLDDGEDIVIDYNDILYTPYGFRNIKKLCLEKRIKGKKVVTQKGLIKRGSNHHPVLVLNEDLDFVFKTLDELSIGDNICIKRGQQVFGVYDIPDDDAYLLGLIIGAGSLSNTGTLSLNVTNDVLLKFLKKYCTNNKIPLTIPPKTSSTSCFTFSKRIQSFLEHYRLDSSLNGDKNVPYFIRIGHRVSQRTFLRGFFDVNGNINDVTGSISCKSSSRRLLSEIQQMLLNFGVVSALLEAPSTSKFNRKYILELSSEETYKYKKFVGFRLVEKHDKLISSFGAEAPALLDDIIPYAYKYVKVIYDECQRLYNTYVKKIGYCLTSEGEVTYADVEAVFNIITLVNKHQGDLSDIIISSYEKLKKVIEENYYYDTVVSVKDWQGDCYDFEMDMEDDTLEPSYITNGFINHNTFLSGVLASLLALLYPGYRVGLISPSFRQSKLIFHEVEKVYENSSIFREATEKRPIRAADSCYLKFRGVAGKMGSFIEALPIGVDGSKIRGSRFYCILIDEFAQVPKKIIETVLAPMGITKLDPMKKVRELERRKKLIELGLATENDFEEESINKMIGTSSGFYKFNHMYKRMMEYWDLIDDGSKDHAVFQIPYTVLPEGFLDPKNIENAKRVMSTAEFKMEYLGEMVSDSEGFFKASVLEACTVGNKFKVEFVGEQGAEYIIGVDPNQGGRAACGVVIIKLGKPYSKVVRAIPLSGKTTQSITTAIQDFCDLYNVIRVCMDRGGGGKAVADLLEEGYNDHIPILNRKNKDNINKKGKHILELVTFSTGWISDANFDTLALLEDKKIRFPEAPIESKSDRDAEAFDEIEQLKRQCTNIVVTQTAGGSLHFDTPKRDQRKDLYSAFILACHGIKALEFEANSDEEEDASLFKEGGLVRQRGASSWTKTAVPVANDTYYQAALLKKK